MQTDTNDIKDRSKANCGVSSTFNFTVGGIAIAAALLIAYLIYPYLMR